MMQGACGFGRNLGSTEALGEGGGGVKSKGRSKRSIHAKRRTKSLETLTSGEHKTQIHITASLCFLGNQLQWTPYLHHLLSLAKDGI